MASLTLASPVMASSVPETSAESPELQSLFPDWLLQTPFRLKVKLILSLDGSEAASDLKARSETRDELVMINPQNWRYLRELPFIFERKEFVMKNQQLYIATSSNRLLEASENFETHLWKDALIYPYELSQRWNFVASSLSWDEWFQKLKTQKEGFQNAVGDSLEVDFSQEAQNSRVDLRLKGQIKHEGITTLNLELLWQIEFDEALSFQTLEQSLTTTGGPPS